MWNLPENKRKNTPTLAKMCKIFALIYNRSSHSKICFSGPKNAKTMKSSVATIAATLLKSQLPPVWPDLANFHHFAKILKTIGIILRSFGIWQNCKPYLVKIYNMKLIFACYKWPNIEPVI